MGITTKTGWGIGVETSPGEALPMNQKYEWGIGDWRIVRWGNGDYYKNWVTSVDPIFDLRNFSVSADTIYTIYYIVY